MPKIIVNGIELHYEDSGGDKEPIVFCHGLICNRHMFEDQVKALKAQYRCVTLDFRGHGDSEVPASDCSMNSLALDVVELIQKLNCIPCHLVGFSMGGFVTLRLAINYKNLLRSTILVDTTADPMPKEEIFQFKVLSFLARWVGFWSIVNQVMPLMFSKSFLLDPEKDELRNRWKKYILSNHRLGAANAVKGVISREGVSNLLNQILLPTLIISGDRDKLADPQHSIKMRDRIQNSKLISVPDAGHMTPVERPDIVNSAMIDFLSNFK